MAVRCVGEFVGIEAAVGTPGVGIEAAAGTPGVGAMRVVDVVATPVAA